MGMTRVLLADDHRLFLEGLRSLLESEFEIVGMVGDGRALVEAARELRPDVIVADVSMPSLNGIDATRKIMKQDPDAKVVLVTMHPDVKYAVRGFEAGAKGYVLKESASNELLEAIREALRGKTYVTPMIAGDLIESYRGEARSPAEDPTSRLTTRQREVLQLLAEGRSAKEIAAVLGVSARTVEFHKYRMMETLSVKTSAELIQFAIKHGIISP
jgi:DNA-binding NarL/FixJ family response regulator